MPKGVKGFEKGHSGNSAGRPKGSLSSKIALKNLLNEVFNENEEKAKVLLQEMFRDTKDFKWLCELKASLEPKEIENIGNSQTMVIVRSNGIQSNPETVARPLHLQP